jgi:hypothetical protein
MSLMLANSRSSRRSIRNRRANQHESGSEKAQGRGGSLTINGSLGLELDVLGLRRARPTGLAEQSIERVRHSLDLLDPCA